VGKPAVASPVGINKDIIIHGVNGFHARTEEQWEEFLSRLISDRDLRRAMGREGRRCVEEKYSLDYYANRYISLIEELTA